MRNWVALPRIEAPLIPYKREDEAPPTASESGNAYLELKDASGGKTTVNMNLNNARYRSYKVIITVFILIFLLVGVLCFLYYKGLQQTVKNESQGYLQEISKQIASNASRNIRDNFAVLGTIAGVLKSSGIKTYKELRPEVLAQQTLWNYRDILLIDAQGNAYDAYGNIVLLKGEEYLREAVVNRRRAMSSSQLINNTECIVFIIPLRGITMNGVEMYALAATYDLTTFDAILSMNAFNGRGYTYIVHKNGSVVVRSSSKYAPKSGYNILSSLSSAQMEDGFSLSQIRNDISENKSGAVSYTQDGRRMYMAYTPLETNEWYLLSFVPVDVVNAKSELLMTITLLLCAAITLAFSILVAYQMIAYSRHKHKLEQIAYVDPITGGNTIERFYEEAASFFTTPGKPQYALVYANVEKFKVLNEEFGRRACDDILQSLHHGITQNLTTQESMGRLFADNFCILTVYTTEEALISRFDTWYENAAHHQETQGTVWLAPIMEFGVYIIINDSMPFPLMVDRAKLALKEASSELRGRLRYAIYDDAIRRQLFREKHLESMMGKALAEREFRVYLQPKYLVASETIGGAEALVRWMSTEGMIFPDEFITLFEKNGFIIQLDLWVFEEVCRSIRAWLDAGITPVKVSVNCSRMHLKNPHFLDSYIEICQRLGTPPEYLEIELTENSVFENVGSLSKIIDSIHAAGFGCSMDDFGSGYSSLNLIQDIPVDTIKLDKVFFRNGSRGLDRTESVVGSILNMSRSLNMTTVAEGVEERSQVDMLKRLKCDYIQGYYFAKPMPIPDFERLAFGAIVEIDPETTEQS